MAKRNRKNSGMEDRMERVPSADAHGDTRSGDEGVDDSAMSATHRDDMTETPMQGDKLDMNEDLSAGNRASESGQRKASQRSERTEERANDEAWDDASDFSGKGGQKDNKDEGSREGTGYTK